MLEIFFGCIGLLAVATIYAMGFFMGYHIQSLMHKDDKPEAKSQVWVKYHDSQTGRTSVLPISEYRKRMDAVPKQNQEDKIEQEEWLDKIKSPLFFGK